MEKWVKSGKTDRIFPMFPIFQNKKGRSKIMIYGMGAHGWGMGFGMGWWWLIGILLVGLVVWLALRSASNANNPPQSHSKSPLDILKERYARGEIDKAEFDEKKKDL